jgi:hypothetical protein
VQTVNLAGRVRKDQAHLRVLDALERFRRPVAVVTLFVPGQVWRNVDLWRPRLALRPDGALLRSRPRAGRPRQAPPAGAHHGDEALRVTAAVLRATAEAARSHGAFPPSS